MTKGKVDKFLEVNSKLEVRLHGSEGKYYKSQVQGVKGNLFLMNPPYRGKDDLLLHKGEQIETILLTAKEKYLFTATVVDRVTQPLQGYILRAPEEATRIQMRQFVRIKVLLDVEVGWPETGKGIDETIFQPAIMVDLSGGGAGLITDEPIPEDSRLLIRFTIEIKNVERKVMVAAVVRRCQKMDDRNKYIIGTAFLDLSDREQDQIVEYIFLKQREQRLTGDGEND